MRSAGDQAEQEVTPVVFDSSTEDLLISWQIRGPFDASECVDCGSYREVAATWNADFGAIVGCHWLTIWPRRVLDRHSSITDSYSSDVAAQYVPSIEGLSGSDGVVQTFKVDWKDRIRLAGAREANTRHSLKPQFL